MYCPACDKEFSPVHSRCPECKGWLRVSGPTVGSGGAGPAIRKAAPALGDMDTATTQKVPPLGGANVPLPSRPKAASAPAVAAVAPAAARGGGLGGDWSESPERPAPPLQSATEPLGRGGLGAGWESSSPVAGPATGWGTPGVSAPPAQGGWGAPAAPAAGLGGSWQAPPAEPPKMGGWGAPAPAASVGLGGGVSSFASPSSLGHSAQMGPAPASTGGGWLGDGGGGGYAAPAARSHGWLGDDAAAAPAAAAALSMPSMTPPELTASSEDALSLPEHTVAVDLGTPWEEEAQAGGSNKMIYMVLACLLLSLVGFSGYVWWQREKLKETRVVDKTENTSVIPTGLMYLKQGQSAYAKRKWEEAQSNGELAFTLLGELKVAKPADRQAAKQFHKQATIRYGQALYDQAQSAFQKQDTNAAIGLSERAVEMYHKIPGTEKQQAQARALEGRIYDSIGDSAGAISAYKKAHELNPAGGYGALVSQARQAARPVQQATQPEVVTIPVEQPSLGDGGGYPTGRAPSGRYVSRTAPPPAAQPVGTAPKPRPANTYVPPKRDSTPSWRKKGSDVLPTYR